MPNAKKQSCGSASGAAPHIYTDRPLHISRPPSFSKSRQLVPLVAVRHCKRQQIITAIQPWNTASRTAGTGLSLAQRGARRITPSAVSCRQHMAACPWDSAPATSCSARSQPASARIARPSEAPRISSTGRTVRRMPPGSRQAASSSPARRRPATPRRTGRRWGSTSRSRRCRTGRSLRTLAGYITSADQPGLRSRIAVAMVLLLASEGPHHPGAVLGQ